MPGINVIDHDGEVQPFPDAASWHVDERGQLHLKSTAGPVATFAKDYWQAVATAGEPGPVVKPDEFEQATQALGEANERLREIAAAVKVAGSRA